jgi:diketogulonate reductase-like aldo/keto reductase
MHTVTLPSGEQVPAMGQGTWQMGDHPSRRAAEIAALRRGVELGLTLIDTAETYGKGASETLIGEALLGDPGRRRGLFIVSKVLPQHAGRAGLPRACRASLKRLGTDYLDLYLLHWRGNVPLAETVEAMHALARQGMIRHWGVSNFDLSDLVDLAAASGQDCAANQILYNPTRRGPEFALLPAMAARAMPAIAYSPIEQGRLPQTGPLARVAARHGVTPFQLALAWVLRRPGIIAIPKAADAAHVEDNRRAADLTLAPEDLAELDAAFPPPQRKPALEML